MTNELLATIELLKVENKKLKAENEYLKFIIDENRIVGKKYKLLEERIEKAIDYIEENYPTSTINYREEKYKLLEILKGEENE